MVIGEHHYIVLISRLPAIKYRMVTLKTLGATMPSFKCTDIGMACPFTTSAKTEDELMKKIAEHAAKAHDMKTVPPEVMAKIKKAIKK